MSQGTHERARGITILEVMVVVAIGALVLGGAMEAFSGGHGLVQDSRARTKANAEHRRNLTMLANTLRTADIRLLGGFDESGVATEPVIRRVIGADLAGRTHSAPETIRWLAKKAPVPGVTLPGALYAVSTSGKRLLADRVPRNTFKCRQQGSMLIVELATYYRTSDAKTITVSGPTAIQLRNWE